jgi:hypothetical protein
MGVYAAVFGCLWISLNASLNQFFQNICISPYSPRVTNLVAATNAVPSFAPNLAPILMEAPVTAQFLFVVPELVVLVLAQLLEY